MNEINTNEHGKAVAALVLGIISCAAFLTGIGAIVGVILAVIGLILAKQAKAAGNTEGICKAGFVLSIIGLCVSGITLIVALGLIGMIGAGAAMGI